MNPQPTLAGPWESALNDQAIEALNQACQCISLDQSALAQALDAELGSAGMAQMVRERCPTLFSSFPVFVSPLHLRRMAEVVRAVTQVSELAAYRQRVLSWAPASAQRSVNAADGVFMGYDFHLHGDQLGLIEINTNAGGAMLNLALARAQKACCDDVAVMLPGLGEVDALQARWLAMFEQEWRLARGDAPLRVLAIVDEQPQTQFLYPEFLLFQQAFERHGWRTLIVDPSQCAWDGQRLTADGVPVDLVYNRLTDFSLSEPASAALLSAYQADAVVVTPHPHAHALFADKRNLCLLTDAQALTEIGVSQATQAVLLRDIPKTELVTSVHADRLWAQRKQLFFKPCSGFGSRAAYRGDKLTRRVWDEILAGDYVAQALVAPGQRSLPAVAPEGMAANIGMSAEAGTQADQRVLKYDLRNYVYRGQVQWVAARLYQGQTTNFRTPGGGFAPVFGASGCDGAC